MATYYISTCGNDDNDGLSSLTPWRTIGRVNACISGGDTVCFCRGETFYGQILPPKQDDLSNPTIYTTYGDGPKPIISQYKIAQPHAWENVEEGIWRLDLKNPSNYIGNTTELSSNVGFLLVSGKIYPRNRFEAEALEQEWDFWCDDRYVYIKASDYPAALSDDIRIACNIHCMPFTDNLIVENIIFCGSGGFGMYGTGHHATVRNCEFHDLGGAELIGYSTAHTRYGNGVECWSNSSDILVENCRFSGIYDVAITMQGDGVISGWENMTFRNNVIWNCQQSFEIWSEGNLPGTGFRNCVFENNVCIDSGYCWGYDVRPDKANSCHLLIYSLECPLCDIQIRNNTFYHARVTPIFKPEGPDHLPDGYHVCDNTFLIEPGQDIAFRGKCSNHDYRAFYEKIMAENHIIVSTYDAVKNYEK